MSASDIFDMVTVSLCVAMVGALGLVIYYVMTEGDDDGTSGRA